jgi:hypothetical protein
MSLKILNYSNSLEEVNKTFKELGSNDMRMTKKRNKNITNQNIENSKVENEEYSEINVLSFKHSFSRLQKNYSIDN